MAKPVNSISGTVCAAIAGHHRYMTPVQAHNHLFDRAEPFHGNEYTRWGIILEQPVADVALKDLRKHYNKDVGLVHITERLQHPDVPWYTGTPDRLITNEDDEIIGVLEIKTAGSRSASRWGQSDDEDPLIPAEYLCQIEWYRHLIQALHKKDHLDLWIAVLIAGQDYRIFKIESPPEFHANLFKTCQEFWAAYVLTDTLPDIDGSKGTTQALSEYFPEAKAENMASSNVALEEMVAKRRAIKENIKELDLVLKTIDNRLRHAIGDNLGVAGSNWTAKWSGSSRTSVNTKALKAAHPEIVKKFESKTTFRRLAVHYKKEA